MPDKAASVFPAAVKTVLCISMQKSAERNRNRIEVIVSDGNLLRSVKNVKNVRKVRLLHLDNQSFILFCLHCSSPRVVSDREMSLNI